jgi:hypothetical protein
MAWYLSTGTTLPFYLYVPVFWVVTPGPSSLHGVKIDKTTAWKPIPGGGWLVLRLRGEMDDIQSRCVIVLRYAQKVTLSEVAYFF